MSFVSVEVHQILTHGLQLADLVARPIALNFLKPGQANRAYEIISGKLGQVKGFP